MSQCGNTHCSLWGTRDHKFSSRYRTILYHKNLSHPNANSHLISAKSLLAQNVLLSISSEGKSPGSHWFYPPCHMSRYMFHSRRTSPRGDPEVDLAILDILLTPPMGSLTLLSILACIHSSNIPSSSWYLATFLILIHQNLFPANFENVLDKQIILRY